MKQTELQEKIRTMLEDNRLGVVSTVSPEGAPQSATVAITNDGTSRLIITTNQGSRKAHNIESNNRVSVVIGTDSFSGETIQLEGTAHVTDSNERDYFKGLHLAKHPYLKSSLDNPEYCIIVLEVSWCRYTNIKSSVWQVEEIKL